MEFRQQMKRVLWGAASEPEHFLTRWVFLRALGFVYLIAFVSLWTQVEGLYGSKGISPIGEFLQHVRDYNEARHLYACPSLFWIASSDLALNVMCGLGVSASLLLIAGVTPALSAMAAWLFYFSFACVGQEFLGFQWDVLLLETGFLAIFLAPTSTLLTLTRDEPPSRIVVWLLRWLCFRLLLYSAIVKLSSGDKTWWNLTAMAVHYQTQPLPTWTAWWMHQLPLWFQKFTTLFVLAFEFLAPFTILAPPRFRRVRYIGACSMAGFQMLLILTGNYAYFNLLAIVLCIPLLDDDAFPLKWRAKVQPLTASTRATSRWRRYFLIPLACALVPLSIVLALDRMSPEIPWPKPIRTAANTAARFSCVGCYGLFANMTTERPEIVLEGSNDKEHWLEYEFKYKPGDVKRRPVFVAPHQPRLDWQMWFAALGDPRDNTWFISFMQRLLEGSPRVLGLLEKNPFPDNPPKYLRATLYDYTFTDRASGSDGSWWQRKKIREYVPEISLDDLKVGPQ